MKTVTVDKNNLEGAAVCLRNGGLVVFPTETVYGLGADASNPQAVENIYKAKGRPSDNPLIVHIANFDDVYKLAREIPDFAAELMERYWPGPLTLIFKKQPHVIDRVTAGLDTVAVRYPSNPIANELIRRSGVFVAAPSANLSGSPSPTVYRHVKADLDGRVDYIVNGEGCEIGLESTVVDASGDFPVILRPGAITLEMLSKVHPGACMDPALLDSDKVEKPKCPGMKYIHYSPKADVIVVCGEKQNRTEYISSQLKANSNAGVMTFCGGEYPDAKCTLSAGNTMQEYGHILFYNLREFDGHGVDTVYAEFEIQDGMGDAVKNRLYKSAGFNIVNV
ncbi:MAG: threonylcarbamoyl-AMP synthase [Clostridia bacterium]|nr:threonylcarbamoyl-AMP synthase [Clostridia bacterium]